MVFGGALLLLASNFWRPEESSAGYFFGTVIVSYVAVYLLSIWSFPVNVQRSDMLPLLSEAGKVLLGGQNPYRIYQFPSETVFLNILPGTVLAFVPAVLTHLDLRFVNIIYVSILALIIYRTTEVRYRREVVALLGTNSPVALSSISPRDIHRTSLAVDCDLDAAVATRATEVGVILVWSQYQPFAV